MGFNTSISVVFDLDILLIILNGGSEVESCPNLPKSGEIDQSTSNRFLSSSNDPKSLFLTRNQRDTIYMCLDIEYKLNLMHLWPCIRVREP